MQKKKIAKEIALNIASNITQYFLDRISYEVLCALQKRCWESAERFGVAELVKVLVSGEGAFEIPQETEAAESRELTDEETADIQKILKQN